ncbi:C-type lectin domain family 4 member E isoform X3 [Macaca nemestrina]|uniref:C-type lectin domain family 4 member E isoform X4 n=1 Tax=Macaca fascicularis TaxID=9541 RepID=UPI0032B087B6
MNSSTSSESQGTERGCFSSQMFLWTVSGIPILFLSACFITRCVVTYHIFQTCHEKKFQLHENFTELSCYNDGSGIIVPKEFLAYKKPKMKEFFIGLSDKVVEGQWHWVDGTPLTKSLSFWDVGEPNNIATLEDCATMRDSSNPRQNWNDATCFFSYFRICERLGINILNKGKSI